MKKILIASAAFLAVAGSAVAQEAPGFDALNPYAQASESQDAAPSRAGRASITFTGATVDATNVGTNDNYTGR